MKKIVFEGKECYIGFKGFRDNRLNNYQKNYQYELNNWYSVLKVDLDNRKNYSYGLNVFSDLKENFKDKKSGILNELNSGKKTLQNLYSEIKNLSIIK